MIIIITVMALLNDLLVVAFSVANLVDDQISANFVFEGDRRRVFHTS